MDQMAIVELIGTMIVGAVSMRAAVGALTFAGRRFSLARANKKYIAQFEAASARVFTKAESAIRERPLSWKGKRRFRVVKRVYENLNGNVCSFYLEPHDGRAIPAFQPGQFLTFLAPVPGRREPEMRCYSLSDSPTKQGYYRVTVKRLEPPRDAAPGTPAGQVSTYFHDHLQEGAVVEALAPAGSFCLDQNSDRPLILIAGGVGITPLLSMLNWLIASGSRREIWLFYGVRNRGEHIMYETLKRLNAHTPNVRILVAYSQPTPSCRKNVDYHVKGHVTAELLMPLLRARDCEIYVCGPNAMMTSLRHQLETFGVPGDNIRFESFGERISGKVADEAGPREQDRTTGFQIEFARSGRTINWTPRDGSVLELAIDNHIKARCSCRQGVCGTCAVRLKNGTVAYQRQPQRPVESGTCLPCIARPQSDLVLDL